MSNCDQLYNHGFGVHSCIEGARVQEGGAQCVSKTAAIQRTRHYCVEYRTITSTSGEEAPLESGEHTVERNGDHIQSIDLIVARPSLVNVVVDAQGDYVALAADQPSYSQYFPYRILNRVHWKIGNQTIFDTNGNNLADGTTEFTAMLNAELNNTGSEDSREDSHNPLQFGYRDASVRAAMTRVDDFFHIPLWRMTGLPSLEIQNIHFHDVTCKYKVTDDWTQFVHNFKNGEAGGGGFVHTVLARSMNFKNIRTNHAQTNDGHNWLNDDFTFNAPAQGTVSLTNGLVKAFGTKLQGIAAQQNVILSDSDLVGAKDQYPYEMPFRENVIETFTTNAQDADVKDAGFNQCTYKKELTTDGDVTGYCFAVMRKLDDGNNHNIRELTSTDDGRPLVASHTMIYNRLATGKDSEVQHGTVSIAASAAACNSGSGWSSQVQNLAFENPDANSNLGKTTTGSAHNTSVTIQHSKLNKVEFELLLNLPKADIGNYRIFVITSEANVLIWKDGVCQKKWQSNN